MLRLSAQKLALLKIHLSFATARKNYNSALQKIPLYVSSVINVLRGAGSLPYAASALVRRKVAYQYAAVL